jgi:hypothetical protein
MMMVVSTGFGAAFAAQQFAKSAKVDTEQVPTA